ncbi:hypothetical protein [Pedobacter gandavensis]|uniref:hypothetical protein n=1 Tax=Pedobacter gandavensis TaxID=2679963 RepID=UPI00292EBB79|nr:hypothetical protein [Pedobacter gandavensis]
MNNIFNFKRFSQLFIKHTQEFYRAYLLSVMVLIGILAITLGYFCYSHNGTMTSKDQFMMFSIFLFSSGAIFTSGIFSNLGNKRKTIAILTLPASHFEKYLIAWLYSFVIFQLVFILGYYTVDFLVLSTIGADKEEGIKLMNLLSPETNYSMLVVGFAFLHSLLFFGAIFFEKLHFIKTVLVVFLGILFISLLNQQLATAIIGLTLEKVTPFATVALKEGGKIYYIEAQSSIKPIMNGMTCVFATILWIGAYFKLKEKQV